MKPPRFIVIMYRGGGKMYSGRSAYRGRNVFHKRRRHIWRWVLLALVLVIALMGVYVAFDNGRVVVRTQKVFVSDLPKALEGFTVLHVSDLNGHRFGPAQKQVSSVLKDRRYQAVCMTGDMVGPSGDVYPFMEFLAALDPTKPVYMIAGDSDPAPYGGHSSTNYSVLADWIVSAQQSRGAVYLGAPAELQVGNATVWFTDASQLSLDLDATAAAYESTNTAIGLYNAEVISQTRTARALMQSEDLHIALSHKPVGAEAVQRMQAASDENGDSFARTVDLILAGGTSGGQWRLPFIGPLWSDGWFPQDDQTQGFHYAGSISLLQYISGGLGINATCPLPPFRLFNTPEMTLITFTGQMSEDGVPDYY